MMTSSGKLIDVTNFKDEDVDLLDIAHALAGLHRWNAATTQYITVESHCLFCEQILYHAVEKARGYTGYGGDLSDAEGVVWAETDVPPECMRVIDGCSCIAVSQRWEPTPRLRLLVLLHDAHEAYLGDITTPTAEQLGITQLLKELKHSIDAAIYTYLGIPFPTKIEQAAIDFIDHWAMRIEGLHFMHDSLYDDLPQFQAWEEVDFSILDSSPRGESRPGSQWYARIEELQGICLR